MREDIERRNRSAGPGATRDVKDEAYAKALVDLAVREFGGLDIASDASSFTTGIALLADGGVSISRT